MSARIRKTFPKMRTAMAAVLLSGLNAMATPDANAVEVAVADGTITLESIDTVPASLLWHAGKDNALAGDGAFTIGYWPIDPESQPVGERGRLIALLMVGRGDVRETPVAVQVWSDVDRSVTLDKGSVGSPSGVVRLWMPPRDCADGEACTIAAPALTIQVEAEGDVRINEIVVGVIE